MPLLPRTLNPALQGLRCLRCQTVHPLADTFEGCPDCLRASTPASVAPQYAGNPAELRWDALQNWLVYTDPPLLGEGRTPLVALPALAAALGITQLWVKNEGANPTGSHKDRMSALAVRRALDAGARTVVAASSGNAGVSLAAYAALAGLDCVIVTTADMSPNWRRAAERHGATLLAADSPQARWQIVARRVQAGEWYPVTNYLSPPVGSHPFGVDGYRGVALELALQWGGTPATDVLVPTSRADLLWGIARGLADLRTAGLLSSVPRVHAVEPHPRISAVLAGADYREAFPGQSMLVSIGGDTVTHQALDALQLCGGTALAVQEAATLADQRVLARQGLYLELSSVAPLTGLRRLLTQGTVAPDARVVLVATSHGYKEHEAFDRPIPAA